MAATMRVSSALQSHADEAPSRQASGALPLPLWPPERQQRQPASGARGRGWRSAARTPTYKPETDWRRNVEGGLRTGLSTLLTLLWAQYGLLRHPLGIYRFFTVIVTVVVYRSTIGEVIAESLKVVQGGIFAYVITAVLRAVCGKNPVAIGFGVFVGIFLISRARRLSLLARKLSSTMVLMGLLTFRDIPYPGTWFMRVAVYLFTFPQGGFFALVVNIIPYPRFALREGALRAQYSCQVVSACVFACVLSFVQGRDERAMAEASLLSEQLKRSTARLKAMHRWMELEILVFAGGFWRRKALRATEAMRRLVTVEAQVLDGLMGMRKALDGISDNKEQKEFLEYLREPTRAVAMAVSAVCENAAEHVSLAELWKVIWHGDGGSRRITGGATADSLNAALAGLGEALELLVDEYDLARVRLIYGVEEGFSGGPAAAMPRPGPASPASPASPTVVFDSPLQRPGDRRKTLSGLGAVASAAANLAAMAPAAVGATTAATHTAAANTAAPTTLAAKTAVMNTAVALSGVNGAVSSPLSPLPEGTPSGVGAATLAESPQGREKLPSNATHPPFRGAIAHRMTDYQSYMSLAAFVFSLVNLCLSLGQLRLVTEALHGETDSSSDAAAAADVKRWSRSNSVADEDGHGNGRGSGCGGGGRAERYNLPKLVAEAFARRFHGVWAKMRLIAGEVAVQLWQGFGPNKEMVSFAKSVARFALRRREGPVAAVKSDVVSAAGVGGGGGGDQRAGAVGTRQNNGVAVLFPEESEFQRSWRRRAGDTFGRSHRDTAGLALWGQELGLRQRRRRRWEGRRGRFQRWARRKHTQLFQPLKLALIITLCSVFALVPKLSVKYAPPVWVPFTAVFVMANESASGFLTTVNRFTGTVLGSLYGYMVAKIVGIQIGSFTWQLMIFLPPWVAFVCCFRYGPTGYAAQVAAFTSVLLFIGLFIIQDEGDLAPFSRMELTLIGCFIYIIVDNLVAPVRAKSLLRQHIFVALQTFSTEVVALERLLFEEDPKDGSSDTASGTTITSAWQEPIRDRAATMVATNALFLRSSSSGRASLAPSSPPLLPLPLQPSGGGPEPGATVATALGQGHVSGELANPGEADQTAAAGMAERAAVAGVAEQPAVAGVTEEAAAGRGRVESAVPLSGVVGSETDQADRAAASVTTRSDVSGSLDGIALPDKGARQHFESSKNTYFFYDATAASGSVDRSSSAAAPATAAAVNDSATGGKKSGMFTSHNLSKALDDDWRGSEKLLPQISGRLASLQDLLAAQANCVYLAGMEPQLWHRPFHMGSYQRLMAAQEEMHASLVLMARGATAFRSICSMQNWRDELHNIPNVIRLLRGLLRHIKDALKDAEGTFAFYQLTNAEADAVSANDGGAGAADDSSPRKRAQDGNGYPRGMVNNGGRNAQAPADPDARGGGGHGGGDAVLGADAAGSMERELGWFGSLMASSALPSQRSSALPSQRGAAATSTRNEERMLQRTQQALHLLETQYEARELEQSINDEWLRFVRRLMATREKVPLSLEFVIRFNTVVFSAQSLQRGLLRLAHALLEVLERERFAYYYA